MTKDKNSKEKKLFDFDNSNIGIRSISLLNDRTVEIPNSKWEITPRTATQSKRLKWDQTPFGVVKVEEEHVENLKVKGNCGFPKDTNKHDIELNNTFNIEEINSILPSEGYNIYNIWNNENIEQIDFKIFDEEEKLFFGVLNETNDDQLKVIYEALYILKKGKKNKTKKVLKLLKKCKNIELALEKIILFCLSFNLSIKDKLIVLKLIKNLSISIECITIRELFFIISKYSEESELENECREILFEISKASFNNFLEKEIELGNKGTNVLVCNLIYFYVYKFGFSCFFDMIKNVIVNGRFQSKILLLNSLVVIINRLNITLRIYIKELDYIIEFGMRDTSDIIKGKIGFIVGLMIKMNILDKNYGTYERILKVFTKKIDNKVYQKCLNYEEGSSNTFEIKEKWALEWIKTLSILSKNSKKMSNITFYLLESVNYNNKSIIKVLNNLINKVDKSKIENFILDRIKDLLVEENKEVFGLFLRHFDNSRVIKNRFNELLLDENLQNLLIEIIELSRNTFYYNLELNFKKCDKRDKLNVKNFHNKGLSLLHTKDKFKEGCEILVDLVDSLDIPTIKFIGNVIYEKIENITGECLIIMFKLLDRIYKRTNVRPFTETMYLCSNKLKEENTVTKKAIFRFLKTVLRNNKINARSFSKLEYIRLSFEASDILSEFGNKHEVINFIIEIGEYVNLQDLVDIFIKLMMSNIGSLDVLVSISQHFGLFYFLPKLLSIYKTSTFTFKLRVLKFLTIFVNVKDELDDKYLFFVLSLIEDAILDKDKEFRRTGLKLVSSILYLSVKYELAIHLLNLVWFCVLDDLDKEFNACWIGLVNILDTDILLKYLIQGLYHPCTRIRKSYTKLYEILILNKKLDDNLKDLVKN